VLIFLVLPLLFSLPLLFPPSFPLSLPPLLQVAIASSEELALPRIAWPTLFVFLAGHSFFLLPPLLLHLTGNTTREALEKGGWLGCWSIPVQAYGIYLLFTAMHDAVHRYARPPSLLPSFPPSLPPSLSLSLSLSFLPSFIVSAFSSPSF